MDLSKHIKELRQRDGLSQEALAERIYVTRQTISNWETERSYPDVQSLLLLSVLFDVSLDELVKGDIEMMKSELGAYKMNVWAWVTIAGLVIGGVSIVPMIALFGYAGFGISVVFLAIGLAAAIMLDRLKKKHNLETYSEVVAFFEGKPADAEKVAREKQHKGRSLVLKLAGGAVVGILLVLVGVLIFKLFIG